MNDECVPYLFIFNQFVIVLTIMCVSIDRRHRFCHDLICGLFNDIHNIITNIQYYGPIISSFVLRLMSNYIFEKQIIFNIANFLISTGNTSIKSHVRLSRLLNKIKIEYLMQYFCGWLLTTYFIVTVAVVCCVVVMCCVGCFILTVTVMCCVVVMCCVGCFILTVTVMCCVVVM